ncbi:MAG: metal dependent phosphohydrolase [Firmicutes bacterium]|nr:metal dependent phosphohydrolase [Bacillota bacterium]
MSPEVTAIIEVPLKYANESMILVRDIINVNGSVLVTAGTVLRQEILVSLRKHNIETIWVNDTPKLKPLNQEITEVPHLISTATRQKMIKILQNSFQRGSIAVYLPYLREAIDEVIRELSLHDHLLIYLTDIRKKSDYLYGHCVDVGVYAIVIGLAMGLVKEDIYVLGLGGMLHDYGKTTISDAILEKRGSLTLDEFAKIKTHASAGYNILRAETKVDSRIALLALQHHERPDGRGYPWGSKMEEIHPLARIVAVADVYDALTTERVYRPAIAVYEAKRIINECSSTQFDPKVVAAFNKVAVPVYIGSSVKLNNGLAGAVLRINSADPSRPVVWTRNGAINLLNNNDVDIIAVI